MPQTKFCSKTRRDTAARPVWWPWRPTARATSTKARPEIAELQVLTGFDAKGQPQTRPPKRDITINDLMLHTSGLCYEFFSADDLKYRAAKEIPTVVSCTFANAMSRDGLGTLECTGWTTSIPSLSNDGEFFPGIDKGWAYTFMANREDAPTGRPAGSLAWAGLANCFYWIDRKNGIGGYWATQILPFQDTASYPGFVEFETAVYHHRK